MGSALRYQHSNVPRQNGELARLKVVQGPDVGAIFVLVGESVRMGRGEDNDVVISDLKASRNHGEILFEQNQWILRDSGSSNGIMHNGLVVESSQLKTGDTIQLGETTLQFLGNKASTRLLMVSPSMDVIQKEQSALASQKAKVLASAGVNSSIPSQVPKQPKIRSSEDSGGSRKKLLYAGVAILGILLFLDDGGKKKKKNKASESDDSRDLASYLPENEMRSINKVTLKFFRSGFREYRERNFLRAKIQFENVLQVAPGHPLARRYIDNCDIEIGLMVKKHLELGNKGAASGKLRNAKGHFESVTRLLHRKKTDPSYIEAQEQLKTLKERMEVIDG